MAKNKTIILITGGSSRLGTVMSTFLADKGYTIYATSRKTLTSERTNLI